MTKQESAVGILLQLPIREGDVAAFGHGPGVLGLGFRVTGAAAVYSGAAKVDAQMRLGGAASGFREGASRYRVVWERGSDLGADGVGLALCGVSEIGFSASLGDLGRGFEFVVAAAGGAWSGATAALGATGLLRLALVLRYRELQAKRVYLAIHRAPKETLGVSGRICALW
ncbi:MAG: hypothetical protein R3B89_07960 [Polyangiaceae bacterium]